MMKKKLPYIIFTVVFALLELLILFFLVRSVIPPSNPLGLEMKEYIAVSPSSLGDGEYALQVTGEIANKGERAVELTALEVTVSNGREQKTLTIDANITLEPRTSYLLSSDHAAPAIYDRVISVHAVTAQGNTDVANAPTGILSASFLISLLLCILVALYLIRFAKQWYYLTQEENM